MLRELFSTDDFDSTNKGLAFALLLGILYLCAMIYYINKKHVLPMFDDIVELQEEDSIMRSTVYGLLWGSQIFILTLFSTLSSQTGLGITTAVGSDCFLIFIGFATLAQEQDIAVWVLLRDTSIYGAALILWVIMILSDAYDILIFLVFCGAYITNLFVIYFSEDLRDKLSEMLGIDNEDHLFDSSDLWNEKKRRYSIQELNDCVDRKDPELIRRINRNEVSLVLEWQGLDQTRKNIRSKFSMIVMVVVFAIKNHQKKESSLRIHKYKEIYDETLAQQPKPQEFVAKKDTIQDEEQPLVANESEKQQQQQEQQQMELPELQYPTTELQIPEGLVPKIIYIIFFPIHWIISVIPSYSRHQPTMQNLIICLGCNSLLLIGCYFLIDWWVEGFSIITTIPIPILGLLIGIIFAMTDFPIEIRFNTKNPLEMEMHMTMQAAITKITLSQALPLIPSMISQLSAVEVNIPAYQQAFAITLVILASFIGALALKHAILGKLKQPIVGYVSYFVFMLIAIILIAVKIV